MSVLVVGGAGFIGGNLVRALLPERVVVVDNLLSSERENIPKGVEWIEGSIADDAVLQRLKDEFQVVFHLATYHGNQSSIADPIADHDNNLITTLKLFERLKGLRRVKKVVYAASGCTLAVHTNEKPEETIEDGPVPLDLDSPYQISKVVGEFYSVYYWKQHRLPTVRARFQNVYGPGEILGAGRWRGTPATVWRNVVPTFVYRALKRMPLRLEGGGEATRDFIHVEDVVRGLRLCAERGEPGEVYNLASGRETSILELAKTINQLAGNTAELEVQSKRPWDQSGRRFGSTKKSAEKLGFEARVSLREGLAQTIAWAKENMAWIDRCIARHASHMRVE